ncbi:hypothetical protein X975_13038, partial [Stegodyphus mimosarum]
MRWTEAEGHLRSPLSERSHASVRSPVTERSPPWTSRSRRRSCLCCTWNPEASPNLGEGLSSVLAMKVPDCTGKNPPQTEVSSSHLCNLLFLQRRGWLLLELCLYFFYIVSSCCQTN